MTTIHGTSTPIKSEIGTQHANGEESKVKLEPDILGASPGVQSDEDLYEDAGDLDFSNAIQGIYLTRIPRFLWENWSKLDDDQEIQLGTVRVEGTGGDVRRVRRYLNLLHGKSI
jgi:transcription initiation factor TFIIF subunit beta